MEEGVQQRWKKEFNSDGRRDSTTIVGIQQRWKEGVNNDGGRD
jgi:hypothetical protein